MDKNQLTLERFRSKVAEEKYYEGQQYIRTIANRYNRAKKFDTSIELLYQSTLILYESQKFDEGTDLFLYMLEVSQGGCDKFETVLPKIVELVTKIPNHDLNLKNVAKSISKLQFPDLDPLYGNPTLNYVIAEKLSQSGDAESVKMSERYLILSTDDRAVDLIISLFFSNQPETYVERVGRFVVSFLLVGNFKFAWSLVNSLFTQPMDETPKLVDGIYVFNNNRLLNFFQLLIPATQRSCSENRDTFTRFVNTYKSEITNQQLLENINALSELYYNTSIIQKQNNIMQQMMAGLMGK